MKRFIDCKSRKTAFRRCPWACVIARCEGGYMCFEFLSDYLVWKNQK